MERCVSLILLIKMHKKETGRRYRQAGVGRRSKSRVFLLPERAFLCGAVVFLGEMIRFVKRNTHYVANVIR